jgi:hypothetical protein
MIGFIDDPRGAYGAEPICKADQEFRRNRVVAIRVGSSAAGTLLFIAGDV